MGMFDAWKAKREQKKILKYASQIWHKNTSHDNRGFIIHWLVDNVNEETSKALLNRYDLTLHDKPSQDESEKEAIAEELIKRGEDSLAAVSEFINKSKNIAYPLHIMLEIVGERKFVEFVLSILTTEEVLFDDTITEKRVDFLTSIKACKHEEIFRKVSELVDDVDDRVQILALEILANQDNTEKAREKLLDLMLGDETSPRMRNIVIDIFSNKEWKLTGFKNKVDALLPEDLFFINKDGIIRKRSRS